MFLCISITHIPLYNLNPRIQLSGQKHKLSVDICGLQKDYGGCWLLSLSLRLVICITYLMLQGIAPKYTGSDEQWTVIFFHNLRGSEVQGRLGWAVLTAGPSRAGASVAWGRAPRSPVCGTPSFSRGDSAPLGFYAFCPSSGSSLWSSLSSFACLSLNSGHKEQADKWWEEHGVVIDSRCLQVTC